MTMVTAKLFQNGKSQAVRLPKAYRFAGDKVIVKRVGDAVVLLPFNNPWSVLIDSLDQFTDDFMADRAQPLQQQRNSFR